MKDPVARQRADEAIRGVEAEMELRRAAVDELRGLVRKADVIPDPYPPFGAANQWTASLSSGTSHETIGEGGVMNLGTVAATGSRGTLAYQGPEAAVRVAVLTVVLCFENLRDALQFDTWGGLQDATSLNERAQVLRGWLGTIATVEMEAATACYDELAGT